MKTTKYLLSALCLAALAAGCTKDSAMRTSSVEGLRISVTAASPSTRTALHEDGLTVLWEEGDQLLLISNTSENTYPLTLDKASLSEDSRQADFVASQAIPEGEYYLASSNVSTSFASSRTIMFNYGDKVDRSDFEITVTDPTKNTHEGGLKTMALLSDKFTVSADAPEISTPLKHYSTLLELPILLSSNTTGADVKLNQITLETASGKFLPSIQMGFGANTNTISSLSVTFADTPALSVGEPYKVYMPLLAVNPLDLSGEEVTLTVSTSAGDFTFPKPGQILAPGYRYTLSDLNIDARPNLITNEAEWNQALAQGKTLLALGADVELTSSATLPTYDVTVTGNYTLTMNVEGRTPSASSSHIRYIPTDNGRAGINSKLTLTGGADLTVKNGYLYLSDLEAGEGSELSSEGGRLVVTEALTVASGATATIASGLVASCKSLYCEGATLTINGKLYYENVSSGTIPSGDVVQVFDAQVPYSHFDHWYEKSVSGNLLGLDLLGISISIGTSTDDGAGPWASANDGTALLKSNPTTSETEHVLSGEACKMASEEVSLSLLGLLPLPFTHVFVAGNLFLGTYGKTLITSMLGGAQMTFGIPSQGRLPIAITGYYDYQGGTIDYIDNKKQTGGSDTMDLYIALATKPYSVDTSDDTSFPGGSNGDLASDPNIVAYGRMTSSETTNGYQPFYIEFTYKDNLFTPSGDLYLLITATSSKDGAQFTGSTSSVLYLDELNLAY